MSRMKIVVIDQGVQKYWNKSPLFYQTPDSCIYKYYLEYSQKVQCYSNKHKIIDIKDDGHKNMFYLTNQNNLYSRKHKKSHFHKTRDLYRTGYSNVKLFDIIGSHYYSLIAIISKHNSLHLIYDR